MVKINPVEIKGNWVYGVALDVHTLSSQYLGQDPFGHDVFDTQRSPLGELVYRLKYGHDKSVIDEIVETIINYSKLKSIDVILPVPPSNLDRPFQPVYEIATELVKRLDKKLCFNSIKKIKKTLELKGITDLAKRLEILADAFEIDCSEIEGKVVLLFDDLYRSGASLNAITTALSKAGVTQVKVLTLTRTRSKS